MEMMSAPMVFRKGDSSTLCHAGRELGTFGGDGRERAVVFQRSRGGQKLCETGGVVCCFTCSSFSSQVGAA